MSACPACHGEVPADAAFCPWCGAAAATSAAPTRVLGSPATRPRDPDDSAATRLAAARRPGARDADAQTRLAPASAEQALPPRARRRRGALMLLVLLALVVVGALAYLAGRRAHPAPRASAPGVAPEAGMTEAERTERASVEKELQDAARQLAGDRAGDAIRTLRDLGRLNVRLGDAALAATWFEAAAAAAREHPPAERATLLADAAAARMVAGQEAKAAGLLDEALRLDPACPEALAHRGTLRLRSGDAPGALLDLETACAARPDLIAAQAARVHALLALGRIPEALAAAEVARNAAPVSPMVLQASAAAALAAGARDRAREIAREAARVAPDRPEVRALVEQTR